MTPRILIVDGHSMIFQWPRLAAEHSRNRALARQSLVKMLEGLQDAGEWQVAVVFDGTGTKPNEAGEPGSIQVFYSKAGQTADSVIERLVAKYARQYDVTVATDDGLERTTIESFGANSMSSRQLREAIQSAANGLEERLRRLRKR